MGSISLLTVTLCLASVWQRSEAICGPQSCTDDGGCTRENVFCLLGKGGTTGNFCRRCICAERDQCTVHPTTRKVNCDCEGYTSYGDFCECDQCAGMCPAGYTRFEGTCNCYKRYDTYETWGDAKTACRNESAFLVTITDSTENAFVHGLTIGAGRNVWIGANDLQSEGQWEWSMNNAIVVYDNWNPGEPNNHFSSEHCAEMVTANGNWNDQLDSRKRAYICEFYP